MCRQSCRFRGVTVHKHRNLLAHAPERLHDEITTDYTDMIYAATPEEMSYAGFWVTRRSGGVVCRQFDDLDAIFKFDTCDDLRQLICAF